MAQNNGLDPQYMTETYDRRGVGTQRYEGPGGTWTQNKDGTWYSGNNQVNDLSGYLKQKKNLTSGADFSGYQSQLDDQLKQQTSANQQYQRLLNDPSAVQETAGYKFAVDQGNQAINRSAAAKGQLGSGGVLAELARYGQGMGAQQYQSQLGNLQQNFQNQNTQTNSLADLMRNSQQFGIATDYYKRPVNTTYGPGGAPMTTHTNAW